MSIFDSIFNCFKPEQYTLLPSEEPRDPSHGSPETDSPNKTFFQQIQKYLFCYDFSSHHEFSPKTFFPITNFIANQISEKYERFDKGIGNDDQQASQNEETSGQTKASNKDTTPSSENRSRGCFIYCSTLYTAASIAPLLVALVAAVAFEAIKAIPLGLIYAGWLCANRRSEEKSENNQLELIGKASDEINPDKQPVKQKSSNKALDDNEDSERLGSPQPEPPLDAPSLSNDQIDSAELLGSSQNPIRQNQSNPSLSPSEKKPASQGVQFSFSQSTNKLPIEGTPSSGYQGSLQPFSDTTNSMIVQH